MRLSVPAFKNMCLNPKWIYKKGNYKEDNYRGRKGDFYELGTYSKCGVCTQCIAEKANNWVCRNHFESKAHTKKCFITLTYAETPYFLVRKDLVNFLKRLRARIDEKIRVFYCGEYGGQRGRAHFHIIIYGWEDPKASYLGINNKGNICYESKIIHDTWKKGRTSYQTFNDHEAPYIALYNTAMDEFKKSYKLTREKVKAIRASIEGKKGEQYKNLQEELNEAEKALIEEKGKYYLIKEFNGWSLALGWEKFQEDYLKQQYNDFQVHIEDKSFACPTPWVKKLANLGDIAAAEEMFRREAEIIQSATDEEERLKNLYATYEKRKKEIIEHHEKKDRKNDEIELI